MKVEFDLSFMGVVYLLVAIGLITLAVSLFLGGGTFLERQGGITALGYPVPAMVFIPTILGGIIALGLLVPVVRRLFKAFMPSA
jgi:hypothetical protein